MNKLNSFWHTLWQQSQTANVATAASMDIQLNNDLGENVLIDINQCSWQASPAKGVKRILLERDGAEKTTRATSIVAYAANSYFSPHSHPQGEEFYVLYGTFSDEHGDYPAGTYVRNPPGSSHKPYSEQGCLIYVKLQQFKPEDRLSVTLNALQPPQPGNIQVLFNEYEKVELLTFEQRQGLTLDSSKGAEVLLLEGQLHTGSSIIQQGNWLRTVGLPKQTWQAEPTTQILLKTGHLNHA